MKIGPLFKWFGSKWQSAKRYPAPKHDMIVEPFAGGAGYSLNHCDKIRTSSNRYALSPLVFLSENREALLRS